MSKYNYPDTNKLYYQYFQPQTNTLTDRKVVPLQFSQKVLSMLSIQGTQSQFENRAAMVKPKPKEDQHIRQRWYIYIRKTKEN